jgi:sensor domain CHASE-containing protein
MKLRTFFLVGVITVTAFFAISQFLASELVLTRGFQDIEDKQTRNLALMAKGILDRQLAFLDNLALDWSEWDDTYIFAQDGNDHYVQSNLSPETFSDQSLVCVSIQDRAGEPVYLRAFRQDGNVDMPLAMQIYRLTAGPLPPLPRQSSASNGSGGILRLANGELLMVVKRPILTSSGSGPAMGSLMMARMITPEVIDGVSALMGEKVSLERPEDMKTAKSTPGSDGDVYLTYPDKRTSVGLVPITDEDGRVVALLKVAAKRVISREGKTISYYYFGIIFCAILLIGLFSFFLLHKKVLNRLDLLMSRLSGRENADEEASAIDIGGNDEIHDLSVFLDTMFDRVDNSKQAILAKSDEIKKNEVPRRLMWISHEASSSLMGAPIR